MKARSVFLSFTGLSHSTVSKKSGFATQRETTFGFRSRSRDGRLFALRATEIEVTHKELPQSRIELTVTVPSEITQKTYDAYIEKIQETTPIPGFRKGRKIPLPLLMQARGGENIVKGEVISKIVEESTEKALKNWQEVALNSSERLETDVRNLIETFEPDEKLVFRISFDILSPVKWLEPFPEIQVEVEAIGDEETDKRNVESYIRTLLKKKGIQRIVADRGLEVGDVAIMDFHFLRPDNRESLPHLTQEKFRFDTDLPDLLGVTEKLIGIQIGETRELEVKFPDTWEPAVYRGIEAIAVVTCHELFSWDLPELTDAFVQSLQRPSLQTAEDLKTSLLAAEMGRRAERMKDKIQDAILQELVKIVDMEVSETALMETAKVKYQAFLLEMQAQGKIGKAAMEQMATEPMLNNYMMSHKTELENDQKSVAAMEAVFKALDLEVTDKEIDAEIEEAEKSFQEMGEEFDRYRLREMAFEVLQNSKVVEWFVANGNVKVIPYNSKTEQT